MKENKILKINGTPLDKKQLESHLEKIATKHNLVGKSAENTYPIAHLMESFKIIQEVYNLLNDNGEFIFSCGHPMDSAPILNDYSDNFVIINDKKYFLLSDYNNEGKRISHWFGDGVETYHRNMSHLVNGLINAGFKLEKMVESYATDEIIKIKPKYKDQREHSYYVYFKAKK